MFDASNGYLELPFTDAPRDGEFLKLDNHLKFKLVFNPTYYYCDMIYANSSKKFQFDCRVQKFDHKHEKGVSKKQFIQDRYKKKFYLCGRLLLDQYLSFVTLQYFVGKCSDYPLFEENKIMDEIFTINIEHDRTLFFKDYDTIIHNYKPCYYFCYDTDFLDLNNIFFFKFFYAQKFWSTEKPLMDLSNMLNKLNMIEIKSLSN